jgi:hypothetical protein
LLDVLIVDKRNEFGDICELGQIPGMISMEGAVIEAR